MVIEEKPSKIITKLVLYIEAIHFFIFRHQMSDAMLKFLGNLSWSFFGGITASFIILILNILFGRLAGPEEYGKYGIIVALSQVLMIPILFGLDSVSVRAIARATDEKTRVQNIASAFYFTFSIMIVILFMYLLFEKTLMTFFPEHRIIFMGTLIFSFAVSFRMISDGVVRGLGMFKKQFTSRIFEVLFVSSSFFFIFFFLKEKIAFGYILALSAGSVATAVYIFLNLPKFISEFKWSTLKEQLTYGKVIVFGTILGVGINSFDKIAIAKYLDLTQLGIYTAYFTASTNLVAQLSQVFLNVFFPTISKMNPSVYLSKLKKVFIIGFFPGVIFLSGVIYSIIYFFGDKYPATIFYSLAFSFLGMLQIILTINGSIIMSISEYAYRKYITHLYLLYIIYFFGYFVAIYYNILSLELVLANLIVNVILSIFIQSRIIRRESY